MPNAKTTLAVALGLLIALAGSALAVISASVACAPLPAATEASGPEASCAEWTDGCVVCVRTPAGPACSTPGIACVRGETRCLRK